MYTKINDYSKLKAQKSFGITQYNGHLVLQPNGSSQGTNVTVTGGHLMSVPNLVPGPPFVFGALLVICALMVAAFIPEGHSKSRRQSGNGLTQVMGCIT